MERDQKSGQEVRTVALVIFHHECDVLSLRSQTATMIAIGAKLVENCQLKRCKGQLHRAADHSF